MSERTEPPAPSPRIPPGERIYAIGDIHGRDDLLAAVHARIEADLARAPVVSPIAVYLGDYVDRGPGSFEVVDRLLNEPLAGVRRIHLLGNHEQLMLDFLEDAADASWLFNGGDATIASYGLRAPHPWIDHDDRERLRAQLRAVVPASHVRFLRDLRCSFGSGDYLFVHAGIRPGRPLDAQDDRDLLWIREPFLGSPDDFGKRVVHGHSITDRPDIRPNRIGIDTGAFYSGRLTCLVLEGDAMRFLDQ